MNLKQNGRLVRSIDDLSFVGQSSKKVLTLFSGGLDSSYLLYFLSNHCRCDVTALTVDVGDNVDHRQLAKIATQLGARNVVVDAKRIFAEEFVKSAIIANAKYMERYPISSSLSRPLMARTAVQKAQELGCSAIIHTANHSQNSLRRLNGSIRDLGYEGFFGSPYELTSLTRKDKAAALLGAGLDEFVRRAVSGDANLWCREFESGELDNPERFQVNEALFYWSTGIATKPSSMSIEIENGVPVSLNGQSLRLVELIERINVEAGSHGIGRYAGLEHLEGEEKVLEVREAPAAAILLEANRHLEMACLDSELLRIKLQLEQVWVREAIEGRWFGSMHGALEKFFEETCRNLSGTVGFDLAAGRAEVRSIVAPRGKYLTDRDGWESKTARLQSAIGLSDLSAVSFSSERAA
jgi:argininosuccinate synthase